LPYTNNERVTIISSTARRAFDSAKVIASILKVKPKGYEVLWYDDEHPEDISDALSLIKSYKDKTDVLIVVTHYEFAKYLPSLICKEYSDSYVHTCPFEYIMPSIIELSPQS